MTKTLLSMILSILLVLSFASAYTFDSEYSNQRSFNNVVTNGNTVARVDMNSVFTNDDVSRTTIQFTPISGQLYMGHIEHRRTSDIVSEDHNRIALERHTTSEANSGFSNRNGNEYVNNYQNSYFGSDNQRFDPRYNPRYDYGNGFNTGSTGRNYLNDAFRYGLNPLFNDDFRVYFNQADALNDVDAFYNDQFGRYGYYRTNDGSRRYFVN